MTIGQMSKQLLALSALIIGVAQAGDSPQFRGPDRNGIYTDAATEPVFARGGPEKAWEANIGKGFSSITVADGRVYSMGNDGRADTIYCFELATGKSIWTHTYDCGNAGGYPGPRSTPTVYEGKVYTFSREAHAICLDAKSGDVLWERQLSTGNQSPQWGYSGAPLIIDDMVIYNAGTAGVALKRDSGQEAWHSPKGRSGYASPYRCTLDGQDTVLIFSADGLKAVAPDSGRKLWDVQWKTSYDVNAADPVVVGNRVFISSNYNRGCALFEVKANRPTKIYENKNMRNHFSTSVYVDGMLFGNDEGSLVCLDFATGEQKWSRKGLGRGGSLILVNGKLMVLYDKGQLETIEPSGDGHKPLARGQILGDQCWTVPTVSDGYLLARNNNRGDIVAVKIGK